MTGVSYHAGPRDKTELHYGQTCTLFALSRCEWSENLLLLRVLRICHLIFTNTVGRECVVGDSGGVLRFMVELCPASQEPNLFLGSSVPWRPKPSSRRDDLVSGNIRETFLFPQIHASSILTNFDEVKFAFTEDLASPCITDIGLHRQAQHVVMSSLPTPHLSPTILYPGRWVRFRTRVC